MNERRDVQLLQRQWVRGVVAAAAAAVVVGATVGTGTPNAAAAPPPVTGTVSCSLGATSTFTPFIGYSRGLVGRHVGPRAKSRWKLTGTLTGCTGAQTGGRAGAQPIDHADIKMVGRATGHQCSDLAADGLELTLVRVRWLDASGDRIGITRVVDGSLTVRNVGVLPPFDPPVTPPGPPTVTGSSAATPTSTAFPTSVVTVAALGDPIPLALPCSSFGPPLTQGIEGIAFSGLNGPSSISVG